MKTLMVLAQIFCGVMLLPWFVITAFSAFADPSKNSPQLMAIIVAMWLYPLVFFGGAFFAWRSYRRGGDAAITLVATLLPVLWALPILWVAIQAMKRT